MKIIKNTFYRLGGADYDVIRDCSKKTKVQYQSIALALFLTVIVAFIGGFDVVHYYTESTPIRIAVATLWALAVLSFDYFLINSGTTKPFFKYLRIAVGLTNIFITITALFVLLNQTTIDSQIELTKSNALKNIDQSYLKAKENRYSDVETKKKEAEKYNSEVVLPEARNGYPGPKHDQKKAVYNDLIKSVNDEIAKLDTKEQQYLNSYQTERKAVENKLSNDFTAKAKLLPEIIAYGGFMSYILTFCLFVFLSYIELQTIALKFSISPDDEYHLAEKSHEVRTRNIREAKANSNVDLDNRKILLDASTQSRDLENLEYRFLMEDLDNKIVREAEIRGKGAILRKKGYKTNTEALNEALEKFVKASRHNSGDNNQNSRSVGSEENGKTNNNDELAKDIFHLTQPMKDTLELLKNNSTPENLAKDIFDWITANIIYDKDHGKFFYRTARETYNDGHGICGELSVLYMAFLQEAGIDSAFAEIIKDFKGDDVAHACVVIKQDGRQFLSDPAYKIFEIGHINGIEWDEKKLVAEYKSWNV